MKIVTIIGARPQFVKIAALSREFSKHQGVKEVIIHTGQHFDANMSQVFFEQMDIPKPTYNLAIHSLSHGVMTGRMLEEIEKILEIEKPELVVVFGDTNSTLAGALAAKKMHIKVAHVEAGLRSFNTKMPEEINRILTDRISDFLFCPTQTAVDNLEKEGFKGLESEIILCGDVMQDVALFYGNNTENEFTVLDEFKEKDYYLATLHREENTSDSERLKSIVEALNEIHETCPVVLPLHPRTKKKLEEFKIELKVKIIEPVGYLEMISLIKQSKLVLTDSGGLQKEAYFFKKNCVTLRDQTEWVELLEAGVNVLVGAEKARILEQTKVMRGKDSDFDVNLYGNGKASKIIAEYLIKKLVIF